MNQTKDLNKKDNINTQYYKLIITFINLKGFNTDRIQRTSTNYYDQQVEDLRKRN